MQFSTEVNNDLSQLESEIVHQIKLCYFNINTSDYETKEQSSLIIAAVNSAVLAGNQANREKFNSNPNISFLLNNDRVIFDKFIQDITPLINKSYNLVGMYSNECTLVVDVTQLLLPYVLNQMRISDNELPVFIGIAFLITKYVINQVDNHQKIKKINELDYSLRELCSENLEYLNTLNITANDNAISERNSEVINKCIEVNKKVMESLDSLEEK